MTGIVEVSLKLFDAEGTLPRGLFLVNLQVGEIGDFRRADRSALSALIPILA